MNIDAGTETYGLMGHPVGHSVSPALQNELIRRYGFNAAYLAWNTEDILAAVKGGAALGIRGFNVTVPHKQAVMPYLYAIDEDAEKIGAVNTLKLTEGGYVGYNTDMPGLIRAFEYDGVSFKGRCAVLIGAGGAAAAALAAILKCGAGRVLIVNRTIEKARMLAERYSQYYPDVSFETAGSGAEAVSLMRSTNEKWNAVQTTSLGMYPKTDAAAVEEDEFYEMIEDGVDIIFNPEKTLFMEKVERAGGRAYNGLKMLLFQGVRSFEIWHDVRVDDSHTEELLTIMRGALKR
ncbi:MAG: shikimate dehydrogenase [Lachnospiraceae bacterium]|nr:shikimate dehydrogenase [Lachnospiraceae bacterium]